MRNFLRDTIPPPPGLSNSFDLMKELFVDLQESGLFISIAYGAGITLKERVAKTAFTYAFLNTLQRAPPMPTVTEITLPEIFQVRV